MCVCDRERERERVRACVLLWREVDRFGQRWADLGVGRMNDRQLTRGQTVWLRMVVVALLTIGGQWRWVESALRTSSIAGPGRCRMGGRVVNIRCCW